MKYYWDLLKKRIERGKEKDICIPFPYPRIRPYMDIAKEMYFLLGGDSGTGKSAWVDETFVLHPYDWWKEHQDETDIKIKIVVFSMERKKELRIAKWVAHKLYTEYNILTDVRTLLGRHEGDSKLTPDVMKKIDSLKEYFYEMQEDVVDIIDGGRHPTFINVYMKRIAMNNGKLYKRTVPDNNSTSTKILQYNFGDNMWHQTSNPPKEVESLKPSEKYYKPDDDDLIIIPIIDHIGRIKREGGLDDRETLNRASLYLQQFRDLYGMSPVAVNQFNRNTRNIRRRTDTVLAPEPSDFKGSGNMYEDGR